MLVVEDRNDDVALLKLAFSRAGLNIPLRVVSDGQEAIDYLKGDGPFADRLEHPLPRVMLLDLHMPRMDGFEVLQWLRSQPGLRRLVVVIFSSSSLPQDVNRAFDLGANSYLVKTADLNVLIDIARVLCSYWLKHNRSPEYS